ncbi:MAG: C40 family peptidase, partial [bacterium]|nr:C40 family peptidase [bacterium]
APAPAPSGQVESAIAFAMSQVGKPYVYGANGPNAWDCSSLTQAAFRQLGIGLGRSSRSQYLNGTQVPLSQARRGDLMFWSSNGQQSGIYHVAIYLGDGMKVHARSPGWGVQHDRVYYANIMPNVVRLG